MKAAAWNIEGRLSRFAEADERGSPEKIIEEISRLGSSVVVLSEAFDGVNPIEPAVESQLGGLGYESIAVAYSEHGDRQYQAVIDPHMILLSKLEIVQYQKCRLGDIRTMIMADVIEPETKQTLRVFGVHLDDRNEANRLKQVEDLMEHIAQSPFPVIAMGDFNAMHSSSLPARLLRNKVARFGIDHFPHASTRDILQRLSEMAIGDTMRRLEQSTDLQRSDAAMRPTTTPKMRGREWMPSVPMVQIDHILVSPGVEVRNFEVSPDGGSDHRAISAEVLATRQNS